MHEAGVRIQTYKFCRFTMSHQHRTTTACFRKCLVQSSETYQAAHSTDPRASPPHFVVATTIEGGCTLQQREGETRLSEQAQGVGAGHGAEGGGAVVSGEAAEQDDGMSKAE